MIWTKSEDALPEERVEVLVCKKSKGIVLEVFILIDGGWIASNGYYYPITGTLWTPILLPEFELNELPQ